MSNFNLFSHRNSILIPLSFSYLESNPHYIYRLILTKVLDIIPSNRVNNLHHLSLSEDLQPQIKLQKKEKKLQIKVKLQKGRANKMI